ncbi:MAG: hypothetical protein ABEJ57_03070 [Halobacteriaceae archaeon]
MLLVQGSAGGTTLTGTLYERGEDPPTFRGAPDGAEPYVWLCDEFYPVEDGGVVQRVENRSVNVAFESPMPRGFDTRDSAIAAARDHLRTQFARLGIPEADVAIDVIPADPA